MKAVVITGCIGMIGTCVTRRCLEAGFRVFGVDAQTYASNDDALQEFLQHKNFTFLSKNICELTYLPDCDYVINLAAETHVGTSIINSDPFLRTNSFGVQVLLNLIKNKPNNVVNRPTLIHFSTDEVYGDIKEGSHVETDMLKPSNPYSASKAAADMFISAWQRTYGVDYVIVRPTNNYGLGQYPEKLIPISVKVLQRGKKVRLHDEGRPVRNWLHAEDTANAVMTIIDAGVRNEIYNIAGNCEQSNLVTVQKIIDKFFDKKVADYSEYLDLEYKREGQDVRYSLCDDKLKKLGWKPLRHFDEEIGNLVQYYKNRFRW